MRLTISFLALLICIAFAAQAHSQVVSSGTLQVKKVDSASLQRKKVDSLIKFVMELCIGVSKEKINSIYALQDSCEARTKIIFSNSTLDSKQKIALRQTVQKETTQGIKNVLGDVGYAKYLDLVQGKNLNKLRLVINHYTQKSNPQETNHKAIK